MTKNPPNNFAILAILFISTISCVNHSSSKYIFYNLAELKSGNILDRNIGHETCIYDIAEADITGLKFLLEKRIENGAINTYPRQINVDIKMTKPSQYKIRKIKIGVCGVLERTNENFKCSKSTCTNYNLKGSRIIKGKH